MNIVFPEVESATLSLAAPASCRMGITWALVAGSIIDAASGGRQTIKPSDIIPCWNELYEPVSIDASKIEDLIGNTDYANGIWALVDIELSKLDAKPERINVSIPRFVLKKIDSYAASRHETRSGFLSRAAISLIAEESRSKESAEG